LEKKYFYGKAVAFTKHDLAKITNHRSGEIKFGEKCILHLKTQIQSLFKYFEAQYVLVGIPDIGIRANFGRPGAASAWDSA
jgi:formiminoglutamase